MSKTNVRKLIGGVTDTLRKRSPEILTGLGIAGMATTTFLAVKATPKALLLIEEAKEKKDIQKLTPVDTIKVAWKPFLPAAITGIASVTCLIGATSANAKRNAAITAAYEISKTALTEYKEAVVETVGEKKAKEVKEAVAKKQIEAAPQPIEQEIILTEQGSTICYDTISGRYFKSDYDKIKKAENILNRDLMDQNYISLNEFYYQLGLPATKLGNELGWNSNDGLIEFTMSSQLMDNGKPVLVVDYCIAPRYGYSDFGRY